MKQYICPSCGSRKWVPTSECPDCGGDAAIGDWQMEEVPTPPTPENPDHVLLVGNTGKPLVFRRQPHPREYGRQLLVAASTEGRFAGRSQFELLWEGGTCMIRIGKSPSCQTLLNGSPLSGSERLRSGDSIGLRGERSGREVLLLVAIYDA